MDRFAEGNKNKIHGKYGEEKEEMTNGITS